jgi:hypothetical protein
MRQLNVLRNTVKCGQLLGAAVGCFCHLHQDWFFNLWIWGAGATFPAYLLGIGLQKRSLPDFFQQHGSLVWWLGLISLALSATALAVALRGQLI